MKICQKNQLELYEHQVGGHHCIIRYNGYILKPYSDHEAFMYNFLPMKFPHLIPFLPQFFGVITFADFTSLNFKESSFVPLNVLPNNKEMKEIYISPTSDRISNEYKERNDWLKMLFHKRFNIENASNLLLIIEYIQLEDLTKNMKLPCILDIKMGPGKMKIGKSKLKTTTESL